MMSVVDGKFADLLLSPSAKGRGNLNAQWQQTDKNRIAMCLLSLKWKWYRAPADDRGHRAWRYQRFHNQ